MMKNKRHAVFFTLIELLVTMLIMALISALLIGTFHTGLMSYEKSSAYEKSALEIVGALSCLKEDMRRFVPVDSQAVSFSEDTMAFHIVSDSPSSHLELVSYSVKDERLERSTISYLGKNLNEDVDKSEASIILQDVKGLNFTYVKGYIPRTDGKDKDTKKTHAVIPKATVPAGDLGEEDKGNSWPSAIVLNGTKNKRAVLVSMLMPVFSASATKEGSSDQDAAAASEKK